MFQRAYWRWLALACLALAAPANADPFTPTPADEPKFESAFKDYVPDEDIEPGGWREANDRVGRIGGWRTYSKEVEERPIEAGRSRPAMIGERVPSSQESQ